MTLPRMVAWVPSIGSYAGLCGSSQTWPSLRWNVLTVASPSISAATISPFSAVCAWLDHDVVAVADGGVDHRLALDLQHEQLAAADQLLGEREDVLEVLLGQDRAAGGDPAEHRDVGGRRERRRRSRSRRSDVSSAAADRAPGGHHLGQEHLEGPRAVGVAPEEALLLEHPELVGDAGGAGQPDGLADLAHARRVAPLLDGVAEVREDPLLPRRSARSRRRARREARRPLRVPCLESLAMARTVAAQRAPNSNICSNGRVAVPLDDGTDTPFEQVLEIVRTPALVSYTCSIERLIDGRPGGDCRWPPLDIRSTRQPQTARMSPLPQEST